MPMLGFIKYLSRRMIRHTGGGSVVEFALVAPAFLMVVMSAIEFSMIMFVSSTVNNAVSEASRLGTTGSNYADMQVAGEPVKDRTQFIEYIIRKRLGPFDGNDKIQITPVSYASVQSLTAAGREVNGAGGTAGLGGGGQMVVYNVNYAWNIITPLLSFAGSQGKYNISARYVVKNEDF